MQERDDPRSAGLPNSVSPVGIGTIEKRLIMNTKPAGNQGLTMPFRAVRRLREAGIFARAGVSLEYQQLAKRYVVRGVESGGAIDNLGHYVTFCGEDGSPLAWLHPLDGIGVNGVHAL